MTKEREQKIRERAYALWEKDGRVDGQADAHWFAAAQELAPPTEAVSAVPQEEILVAAKPKAKRRSPKAAPAAAVAEPAPRRRRSSATTLN
jgi:hypothetical protein